MLKTMERQIYLENMPSRVTTFRTRELSAKTWLDFEKLFRKPGEWGGCWCMYYHRPRPLSGLTREERIARNRREKKCLAERGCSHGVLVYAEKEPVGWCQYGRKEELPRIDAARRYRKLALRVNGKKLWRITCFVVDRNFRRRGVARIALKAALASIKKKGGGPVEAYPATRKGAGGIWFGTVSMFEREGFKRVAPFGTGNILMRTTVRRS